MNINVLDANGRVLDNDRSLSQLKEKFAEQARQVMAGFSEATIEKSGLTDWDFGKLEKVHEIKQGGLTLLSWPALVDEGDSVSLKLEDSPFAAIKHSRSGVARLYMLKNRQQWKYLQKQLLQDPSRLPAMKGLGGRDALVVALIQASYQAAFQLDQRLPQDRDEFEEVYNAGRPELIETSTRLESLMYKILKIYGTLSVNLSRFKALEELTLQQDIASQLKSLVYNGFLAETPVEILAEFPRYFSAIELRLEKYPRQKQKDKELSAMLQAWWVRYEERLNLFRGQHKSSAELENFRWMLEELRVSLFAQALGTRYPISEKRLEKAWAEIR